MIHALAFPSATNISLKPFRSSKSELVGTSTTAACRDSSCARRVSNSRNRPARASCHPSWATHHNRAVEQQFGRVAGRTKFLPANRYRRKDILDAVWLTVAARLSAKFGRFRCPQIGCLTRSNINCVLRIGISFCDRLNLGGLAVASISTKDLACQTAFFLARATQMPYPSRLADYNSSCLGLSNGGIPGCAIVGGAVIFDREPYR